MNNYEKVILKMFESGKIPEGQLYSVDCKHDTWCAINSGGECSCNVDVTFTTPHTEQCTEGKRAKRARRKGMVQE